jgi:general stress protein 26
MKEEYDQNAGKLVELIEGIKSCMFITKEKFGENIDGRPMGIAHIEKDGTMWFFTKATSLIIDELELNSKVSIVIINESKNTYLMIHGKGESSYNKHKMEELWNPIMKTWFPQGLEDPDMMLIKVTPHEVSYWDSSASKMVVLFNMIKSIITGKEYDEGKHGKINL